jgi:hypothetical protein
MLQIGVEVRANNLAAPCVEKCAREAASAAIFDGQHVL